MATFITSKSVGEQLSLYVNSSTGYWKYYHNDTFSTIYANNWDGNANAVWAEVSNVNGEFTIISCDSEGTESGNLTGLGLWDNQLTSFDGTGLSSLEGLNLDGNQLTSFDGTGLSGLTFLTLVDNPLTSFNGGDMSQLTSLNFYSWNITTLTSFTGGGMIGLTQLQLRNCQLDSIDLSGLISLQSILFRNITITNLTISDLPDLQSIYIDSSNITNFSLTNLPILNSLVVRGAINISLDNLPGFTGGLGIESQVLETLNVSNVNCTDVYIWDSQLHTINIQALPSAISIQISGCPLSSLTFNNLPLLTSIGLDGVSSSAITTFSLTDLGSLESFGLTNTQLTSFELSGISTLINVDIYNNSQLSSLTLTDLPLLSGAYLTNNALTSFDASSFSNLIQLNLVNNQITNVSDVIVNSNLENLRLVYNPITSVTTSDLSGMLNLKILNIGGSVLESYDFTSLVNLQSLYLPATGIQTTDNLPTTLIDLDLSENGISSIDLSDLPNLEALTLYNNNITSLSDITGLSTNLVNYLDLSKNNFTTIDVSSFTNLNYLYLYESSNLTTVNISGLVNLKQFNAYNSKILSSISFAGLTSLEEISLQNNTVIDSVDLTGLVNLQNVFLDACPLSAEGADLMLTTLNQSTLKTNGYLNASIQFRTSASDSAYNELVNNKGWYVSVTQLNDKGPIVFTTGKGPGETINGRFGCYYNQQYKITFWDGTQDIIWSYEYFSKTIDSNDSYENREIQVIPISDNGEPGWENVIYGNIVYVEIPNCKVTSINISNSIQLNALYLGPYLTNVDEVINNLAGLYYEPGSSPTHRFNVKDRTSVSNSAFNFLKNKNVSFRNYDTSFTFITSKGPGESISGTIWCHSIQPNGYDDRSKYKVTYWDGTSEVIDTTITYNFYKLIDESDNYQNREVEISIVDANENPYFGNYQLIELINQKITSIDLNNIFDLSSCDLTINLLTSVTFGGLFNMSNLNLAQNQLTPQNNDQILQQLYQESYGKIYAGYSFQTTGGRTSASDFYYNHFASLPWNLSGLDVVEETTTTTTLPVTTTTTTIPFGSGLVLKSLAYGDGNPVNRPLTLNELEGNFAYLNDYVNSILESSQSIEDRLLARTSDLASLAARITAIENGVVTTTTTTEEQTTTTTTVFTEVIPNTIVADGLVLHFDIGSTDCYNGGSTIQDLSGNGYTGTINGATYDSENGGNLYFNGSTYVTTDYVVQPINQNVYFTWEAWFKVNNGSASPIIGNRDGSEPRMNFIKIHSGSFEFATDNGGSWGNIGLNLSQGTWTQVVAIKEGTTTKCYVNGNYVGQVNNVGNISDPNLFFIGGDPNAGELSQSNVSIVRIYNRALREEEILHNYQVMRNSAETTTTTTTEEPITTTTTTEAPTTTTTTTEAPIITFTKASYGTDVDVVSSYLTLKRADNQGLFNLNEAQNYLASFFGGKKHLWASEKLSQQVDDNPQFWMSNIWNTFDPSSIDVNELDSFYGPLTRSNYKGLVQTENLSDKSMVPWEFVHRSNPPSMLNKEMIMLDVDDRKFYKVKFTMWGSGGSGGAVTYTRQFLANAPTTTTTTTEEPTTTTTTTESTSTFFNSVTLDSIDELSKGITNYVYRFTIDPKIMLLMNEYDGQLVNAGGNRRIAAVACPVNQNNITIDGGVQTVDIIPWGISPYNISVTREIYYETYGTYDLVFKMCEFQVVNGDWSLVKTIGEFSQSFNLEATSM